MGFEQLKTHDLIMVLAGTTNGWSHPSPSPILGLLRGSILMLEVTWQCWNQTCTDGAAAGNAASSGVQIHGAQAHVGWRYGQALLSPVFEHPVKTPAIPPQCFQVFMARPCDYPQLKVFDEIRSLGISGLPGSSRPTHKDVCSCDLDNFKVLWGLEIPSTGVSSQLGVQ